MALLRNMNRGLIMFFEPIKYWLVASWFYKKGLMLPGYNFQVFLEPSFRLLKIIHVMTFMNRGNLVWPKLSLLCNCLCFFLKLA